MSPGNHPGDIPGRTPDEIRPVTQTAGVYPDATHPAEEPAQEHQRLPQTTPPKGITKREKPQKLNPPKQPKPRFWSTILAPFKPIFTSKIRDADLGTSHRQHSGPDL